MLANNRAYMKMIFALISFFLRYVEKIKDNAIIQNTLKLINEKVNLIEHFRAIQKKDTTGFAKDKKKSKKQLASTIFLVSGAIRTYAYDTSNTLMYNAVKLPVSRIAGMGDTVMLVYTENVKKIAKENFKELEAYGLTKENMDKLEAEHLDFLQRMTKPREAIAEKATATIKIKETIKELRNLVVGNLDNAMLNYISSDNVFYNEYEQIREIVDPATRHLDVYGYVIDEETRLALKNVAVTIIRSKATADLEIPVQKLTTEKGYYRFKSLEPGKYIITFSFENYDTLEKEIVLYPGESMKLDVALRKTE